MPPKPFLRAAAIAFVLAVTGYFALVDALVVLPSRVIGSYRFFLADAAGDLSDRLFIVAGSNALHGLDALALEARFGRPAVALADNGGYPLALKLEFLAGRLKPGDTLLLPLEWQHYARRSNSFPLELVQRAVSGRSDLGFYYRELPLRERIVHALHEFPVHLVLAKLFSLPHHLAELDNLDAARLSGHLAALHQADRRKRASFDGTRADVEPRERIAENRGPCDRTLFSEQLRDGFEIGAAYRADLAALARLRDRGVRVLLTWPTVVGAGPDDRCYGPLVQDALPTYVERLRGLAGSHGLDYLGEPEAFQYETGCFLNTHYHLTPACADRHTARMVELLGAAGLAPTGRPVTERFDRAVAESIERRADRLLPQLTEPVRGGNLPERVLFGAGWYLPERWGIWSREERSDLLVRLPAGGPLELQIRGTYFGGVEATEVRIEGRPLATLPLEEARLRIDTVRAAPQLARLTLIHRRPTSPHDLDPANPDTRRIKFGLIGIGTRPAADTAP